MRPAPLRGQNSHQGGTMAKLWIPAGVIALTATIAACSSSSSIVPAATSLVVPPPTAPAPTTPASVTPPPSSTPLPASSAPATTSATTAPPPSPTSTPAPATQAAAPTHAVPPPTSASSAWCRATASVYYARYDENNVYVYSNQPYRDATASADGDSWSYETNGSGYALIYLNGPPPGALISVTVGGATCTTSD
jgi:hypothetical protein